jgi:PAS domain S-box-containing protein
MTELAEEVMGFAATVESQRKRMLHRASVTLCPPGALPITEQFDAVPQLSALLTASLEELKVAQEELTQQQEALIESRAQTERLLSYYRLLFELSPTPTIVTDLNAAIRDANRAACALLKRTSSSLNRKPLAALVPPEQRASFRAALTRLELTHGASNWVFSLDRHTDVPVTVNAAVCTIPDRTIGSGALLWQIFPSTEADEG